VLGRTVARLSAFGLAQRPGWPDGRSPPSARSQWRGRPGLANGQGAVGEAAWAPWGRRPPTWQGDGGAGSPERWVNGEEGEGSFTGGTPAMWRSFSGDGRREGGPDAAVDGRHRLVADGRLQAVPARAARHRAGEVRRWWAGPGYSVGGLNLIWIQIKTDSNHLNFQPPQKWLSRAWKFWIKISFWRSQRGEQLSS
jgi:hypothetical protein